MRGVVDGLGNQLSDLWEMIKDPSVLWDIVQAFKNDARGTLEAIVNDLGEQFQTVLECGPKDIGRVIGENVNPAIAAKILGKLGKLAGNAKLSKYSNNLDYTLGCASFPEGTPIWTPEGLVPIESIAKDDYVVARSDSEFTDEPQKVLYAHSRVANGFHRIETEFGAIDVTAEHPFWVQGKGWVEAQDLGWQDPIVTGNGDAVAYENTFIEKETRVYNFTVDQSHTYFAGEMSAWVHNASPLPCPIRRDLPLNGFDFDLNKIDIHELFSGTTTSKYRKNLKEKYPELNNVNVDWQAHHVIPKDVFDNNSWLKDAGFDINSDHNMMPMFCTAPSGLCETPSVHLGSHENYSTAMGDFIKELGQNDRILPARKAELVASAIDKARDSLNTGIPPLRNVDGAEVGDWSAVFKDLIDDEIKIMNDLEL